MLFGTCFLLVAVIQALNALVSLPRRAREWRALGATAAAQAALRDALAQYFGGRYTRAQKSAQQALAIQAETPELAQDHEFTVLAHLLAAGSAHRLQDRRARDEELRRALERSPAQPRGALGRGWRAPAGRRMGARRPRRAARAASCSPTLPPGVARRTQALRLKLQAARLAAQAQEALQTARLLAKHQGFSQVAALGLLRSLAFEALDTAHDVDQLRRLWQRLDAADRRDPFVAARAATRARARRRRRRARRGCGRSATASPISAPTSAPSSPTRWPLAVPGIGADWLPRLESAVRRPCRATAASRSPRAARSPSASSGARRAACSSRPPTTPTLAAAPRRKAWIALAELAAREGDAARAAAAYETAARLG